MQSTEALWHTPLLSLLLLQLQRPGVQTKGSALSGLGQDFLIAGLWPGTFAKHDLRNNFCESPSGYVMQRVGC